MQLSSTVQHLGIRKDTDGSVHGTNAITGEPATLEADALCSMNMFGLTPDFFQRTDEVFRRFLLENGNNPGKEFDPPFVLDCIIKDGTGKCSVLATPSRWFGVTYRDDRPAVVARFKELTEAGVYPSPLWK